MMTEDAVTSTLFIDCLILWRIVQQMFMVSEELLEIFEDWELTYWETQEKSGHINLQKYKKSLFLHNL